MFMKQLRKAIERIQHRLDFSAKKADEKKPDQAASAKRPPKRKRRR